MQYTSNFPNNQNIERSTSQNIGTSVSDRPYKAPISSTPVVATSNYQSNPLSQAPQNIVKSSSSLPGGVGNVELYKQLDILREENFQLKQKQREYTMTINNLKEENGQLLDNAESEIKRMSDFVDKFTQDAEASKKKTAQDFEIKFANERQKTEELKQKYLLEKSEIEIKFLKSQKENEAIKMEITAL